MCLLLACRARQLSVVCWPRHCVESFAHRRAASDHCTCKCPRRAAAWSVPFRVLRGAGAELSTGARGTGGLRAELSAPRPAGLASLPLGVPQQLQEVDSPTEIAFGSLHNSEGDAVEERGQSFPSLRKSMLNKRITSDATARCVALEPSRVRLLRADAHHLPILNRPRNSGHSGMVPTTGGGSDGHDETANVHQTRA